MAKGSQFERETCRQLSAWWTGDKNGDVVFWRTSQSGGRATVRTKSRKRTHAAHCGDIAALDESAAVLTKLITWELKRGYATATLHALLDRKRNSAAQIYELWIQQAVNAADAAGTPFWAIVHKRNGRETVMTVPNWLIDEPEWSPAIREPIMRITLLGAEICSFRFDTFLAAVSPDSVRKFAQQRAAFLNR